MNSLPKPIFLWIDLGPYEKLRQQVLRREGWRYQSCGRMANLEIHHRNSHSGHDVEENLITVFYMQHECTINAEPMHRTRRSALKADS